MDWNRILDLDLDLDLIEVTMAIERIGDGDGDCNDQEMGAVRSELSRVEFSRVALNLVSFKDILHIKSCPANPSVSQCQRAHFLASSLAIIFLSLARRADQERRGPNPARVCRAPKPSANVREIILGKSWAPRTNDLPFFGGAECAVNYLIRTGEE